MNKDFFNNIYINIENNFYINLENALHKLLSPKAYCHLEVCVDGLSLEGNKLVMDPDYRFVEETYQHIKEQPMFGHCIDHNTETGKIRYIIWALPYDGSKDVKEV